MRLFRGGRPAGPWRAGALVAGVAAVLQPQAQRQRRADDDKGADRDVHAQVVGAEHRPVGPDLAGVDAQERQDQAGRDRDRGHEPDRDGVPHPPVIVSPPLDAFDRGQFRADRGPSRSVVAAFPAKPIDSYSALWKLSTRSDGTSKPRSAEASTL